MKSPLFFFIFSLYSFTLFAQTAPNFTITTTDGQVRKLHEDYLDKGKTVMLKLFFTTCPFCINISPKVQKLYEKWGSGNNGVEFISLAVLQSNTNALVKAYKTAHNETFLGAGSDGGSMNAVLPYTSGQFGPYFGAPTFVVIGPDKKVIYDPSGNSDDETISNLDEAIESTRPKTEVVSGFVMNACQKPLKDVSIKLFIDGVDTLITKTDTLGKYKFNFPTGSQSTSNSKFRVALNINYETNIYPCLTTADLVAINKFILKVDTNFTPIQKKICDVNGDNKVSTADMIKIRKVILIIDDSFNGKVFNIGTDSVGYQRNDTLWSIPKTSSGPYNYLNFSFNYIGDANCSCKINNFQDPIEAKIKQNATRKEQELEIRN